MKNGITFYEGASELDGSPILAIATGLIVPSTNRKTGPVVQTWVIPTSHPWEAAQSGMDAAVCGSCVHRGHVETGPDGRTRNVGRSCYVSLSQAPANVWRSYRKGLYEPVTPVQAMRLFAGRVVRLTAYGDASALPPEILEIVLSKADSVLGYTTNWADRPDLARWCMASCSTEDERALAKAMGFRTFRVRSHEDPLLHGEGQCPASAEMGRATQCSRCLLCSGTAGKGTGDISVLIHGSGAGNFHTVPRVPIAA